MAEPCVYERVPGAASAPLPKTYRPRAPQSSPLHRIVREHLKTFLAEGIEKSASGEGYPYYIEKEFLDLLTCGDMTRGFSRLRCKACGHDMLVPFSCKNRCVCPSCTGRRMADEASYLVDQLLPQSDYRQWTVTFPWPIRYLMAKDYKVITAILKVVIRVLFAYQRKMAKRRGEKGALCGAVTFVHRAGRVINAHLHFHILLPDAVFVRREREDALRLFPLPKPFGPDLLWLIQKIARRVTSLYESHIQTLLDPEEGVFEGAISESMRKLPLFPSLKEPDEEDGPDDTEKAHHTSRYGATADGFSIHAGTMVNANNRCGLEHLCRYGLRPPFSQDRLRLTEDGKVQITLQKPWPKKGGVTALQFDGVTFLRRLAPLIPPPFANLIRYHGTFAPRAKYRDLLPAAPISENVTRPETKIRATAALLLKSSSKKKPKDVASPLAALSPLSPEAKERLRRTHFSWAELLRRVFAIDILLCPKCGGEMQLLAYITETKVVEKILAHLGVPTAPLILAPARQNEQLDLFDDPHPEAQPSRLAWSSRRQKGQGGRAPPEDENGDEWVRIDEKDAPDIWGA